MIDDKSVPMNYFAAYDEVSLYIELDNFEKKMISLKIVSREIGGSTLLNNS